MKLFGKKNISFIGVDLGSAAIKIVELKKENNLARLVTYGLAVKEKSDISRNARENKASIIAGLRTVLAESRVTTNKAVGALPATSVFNTIIRLPDMPKKEIDSAARWEAKKLVPLPLDKMSLHWHILPPDEMDEKTGQKNLKIILNAAPKELAKNFVEIFKAAGLRLMNLETETNGLQRSLLMAEEKITLVIDIGATSTNLIVFHRHLPLINRNVEIGTETVNLNIANALNIDIEQAEKSRSIFGLPLEDQADHPVERAIKFIVDSVIVHEIKNLITILRNVHEQAIGKIIIIGGGAHLKNLTAYLQKTLKLETVIGNPWQSVVYPQELKPELFNIGPQMAVAVGIALKVIAI